MFEAKHLKTKQLQKTIEYKSNEQSTKYSHWNIQIKIWLGKVGTVLAVFVSTKLALNYFKQAWRS